MADASKTTILFLLLVIAMAPLVSAGDSAQWKDAPTGRLPAVSGPEGQPVSVYLYFTDRKGDYLHAEERVLPPGNDPVNLAKSIVTALIEGPKAGLTTTIPAHWELRSIFLGAHGIAYVDFSVRASEGYTGDVRSEMLTIYSIVNSLVANVEEIKAVKLLIGGSEAETLAGHVDIRPALKAEMLFVR